MSRGLPPDGSANSLVTRGRGSLALRAAAVLALVIVILDYLSLKTDVRRPNLRFSVNYWSSVSGEEYYAGSNVTSSRVRVLCWVLTGPATHYLKAVHVKRTWGKRCHKLLFMSSVSDGELGAVALEGVKEGRDWLWAKTKAALKYIWEHHRDDAEWFLKADDDTYVVMENLHHFLQDFNASMPLYFGCRLKYQHIPQSVNFGGAGYVLSKEALRTFIEEALPHGNKCDQGHDGDEDTQLGICLSNIGIEPTDTRDKLGRHRFLHSTPEYHFGLTPGKWSDVRDPEELGLDCCSDGLISFHHVRPDGLYALEFMIYHFKLHTSLDGDKEGLTRWLQRRLKTG